MESGILLILFLVTAGLTLVLAFRSKKGAKKAQENNTHSKLDGIYNRPPSK